MSKKVTYVVGATLDGPVNVDHIIDGEKTSISKHPKVTAKLPCSPKNSKGKDTSKRTCGHSQKDARLRRKNS